MKKFIVLLACVTSPLLAHDESPQIPEELPGEVTHCVASQGLPTLHKALQEVLSIHFDAGQLKAKLEAASVAMPKSDSGVSAGITLLEIVDRLDDGRAEMQRALSSLDNPENIALILALSQARVTAANGKWRNLKRLELDAAIKSELACLEESSRSINDRLKMTLEGL